MQISVRWIEIVRQNHCKYQTIVDLRRNVQMIFFVWLYMRFFMVFTNDAARFATLTSFGITKN